MKGVVSQRRTEESDSTESEDHAASHQTPSPAYHWPSTVERGLMAQRDGSKPLSPDAKEVPTPGHDGSTPRSVVGPPGAGRVFLSLHRGVGWPTQGATHRWGRLRSWTDHPSWNP